MSEREHEFERNRQDVEIEKFKQYSKLSGVDKLNEDVECSLQLLFNRGYKLVTMLLFI